MGPARGLLALAAVLFVGCESRVGSWTVTVRSDACAVCSKECPSAGVGEVSFQAKIVGNQFHAESGPRVITGTFVGDAVTGNIILSSNACTSAEQDAVSYRAACTSETHCVGTWEAPEALASGAKDPGAFRGTLSLDRASTDPDAGTGCPEGYPVDCGTYCCTGGTCCSGGCC